MLISTVIRLFDQAVFCTFCC